MKPASYLVATFFLIQFNTILYAQKADYFPLEIGNKWIYDWEGLNGQITRELVDTLSINNNLYYCLLEEQNSPLWGKDTLFYFYRKDSLERVWVAHPNTLKESLTKLQFNRPPGLIDSTYDSINNLTRVTTLQDTNYTVNTPAGTFHHCYYFNYLLVEIHTDFADIYAPSIGLVRTTSEGEGWILRGALINGVLYGDTTKTFVERKNMDFEQVQTDIVLYQNYPNPSNQHTTISYKFNNPESTNIKLAVFDIRGREVVTLINEKQLAGRHTIKWNVKDARGQQVGSGLFFYRLIIGEHVVSRKLLITK